VTNLTKTVDKLINTGKVQFMNTDQPQLIRNLHSEAAENGITIKPTEALDDKCPDCGCDIYDLFYVEEWGRTYCDECLDRELIKFLPNNKQ
jgi:hypothetical protein